MNTNITYINNKGLEYVVLGKTTNKTKSGNLYVKVRFIETGYEYEVEPIQIKRGTVKDRWAKTVLGVGSIGDIKVEGNERAYNVWHKMLSRCYIDKSENYNLYGGMGVTVSERWSRFQYFVEDIPLVDGYNKEAFDNSQLELDKDLKQAGKDKSEMVYSLETCTFMSAYENSMLVNNEQKKHKMIATDENSNEIEVFGIKNWCKENGFTYNSVRLVLNGKQKLHKGWSFRRA